MFHKHPLENPSLAPLHLTTALSYRRLQYEPTSSFWVFEERMSARLWEKRNRMDAQRPLPVERIIHSILPAMAARFRIDKGDFVFEGKPYLTRDIVTLSSAVQWFGTNIGRCFIDEPLRNPPKNYHASKEFALKLAKENRDRDFYAFLSHRCTNACNNPKRFRLFMSDPCLFDSRKVTERDRAVIDGLMRWLGTTHGRQYLTEFSDRRKQAHQDADRRRRQSYELRRKKAA